jgi:hypothetical protein
VLKNSSRKVSDEEIFQKLFSQQDMDWTACLMKYDALDKHALNELEQTTKQSIIAEIIEEIEQAFTYTPKVLSGGDSYDRLTLPPYSSFSVSSSSNISNRPPPPPPPPTSCFSSSGYTSGNKNSSLITHRVRFNDENKVNYASQDNNGSNQHQNQHQHQNQKQYTSELQEIKTFLPSDPHQKRVALSEQYQTILNSKNLSVDSMKHTSIKSVGIKNVASVTSTREINASDYHNLRFSSESLPLQQSEPAENEPPSSSSTSLSSSSFRRTVFPTSPTSFRTPSNPEQQQQQQPRRTAEDVPPFEKHYAANKSKKEIPSSEMNLFRRNQRESDMSTGSDIQQRSENQHQSSLSLENQEQPSSTPLGDEFYSYTSLMDDMVNDFIEETKQHSSHISSSSSSILTSNNPIYEEIEKDYHRIFSSFDNLISNHKNKLYLLSFEMEEGITPTEEREEQEEGIGNKKPFSSSSSSSSGDLNKTVQKYVKKFRKLTDNEKKLSEYNKELTSEIHHQHSSLEQIVKKSHDFIVKCSNLISSSLSSYDYALKWKIHLDSIVNIEMVRFC